MFRLGQYPQFTLWVHRCNKYSTKNEIIQAIQGHPRNIITLQKKIEFLWVILHTGIIGNELADKAANEAIVSSLETIALTSLVRINKITLEDALLKINSLTKNHWQDKWKETPNTNKLKEIKTSIAPWKSPSLSSRHEEIVITRTRIGHSSLTHLHLMTKEDCPDCNSVTNNRPSNTTY